MSAGQSPRFEEHGSRSAAIAGLEALQRAELLDKEPENRFDRITALVRDVLDVPVCLVSLVDDARQFFMSASGLAEPWASRRETPLSHSFCKHVVQRNEPLIVTNAASDPRVIDNLAIRDLGIAAYLGVPVHIEGHAVGALCAIDTQPRLWKTSELDRLSAFAHIVDEQIEMRALIRERDEAQRESELLSHEHSHRIKNSLAVAASLVAISATEAGTKEELARIARDRIQALSTAQNLVWLRERASGLRELLSAILAPYLLDGDEMVTLNGRPITLPFTKITPISLIFHELATNASKYGALSKSGGRVVLDWSVDEDTLSVHWSERLAQAPGLAEARPAFDGAAPAANGFGTRLIELCVRQLSGELCVTGGENGGREITITLPWPRVPA